MAAKRTTRASKAPGITLSPEDAFDKGVADAAPDAGTPEGAKRLAQAAVVKRWFSRIAKARQHDKPAYDQLAKDRAYARGDSPFMTVVNVIGSYIDTWTSLLYARDPDLDVLPAPAAGPKRIEDARLIAKGLMIVVSTYWKRARLKANARPWVRAGLTSKIGWLKVTWAERQGSDPTTQQAIADLQDQIESVARLAMELKEQGKDASLEDARTEELRLAILSLSGSTERKVKKSLVIDPVDMADITISDECPSAARYLDSPWISQRTFLRLHAAKVLCPDLTIEDFRKATLFSPKPMKKQELGTGAVAEHAAGDVDLYAEQAREAISDSANANLGDGFVCVEEVWDRDTNTVVTLLHGLDKYAREPYEPNPGTSRFYPFFGLTLTNVDGQRWPQSLNERSQSLQDAFSRALAAFEEHRRRIKPKVGFNAGLMSDEEVKKIIGGATTEFIPIRPTNPKQDMRQLLFPILYAPIDMAVYDVSHIMRNFELIWGLQEALTATVDVAKTATEAEIQQSGTQSRTGDKRDALEDELTEMAIYTAEILVQKLTRDEAALIAGPEVLWLEGVGIEELEQLVSVNIRAGSSGKPNTRAQREAWAATMPLIQTLLEKIATLRLSNPLEVAQCLEELVTETAERSGESIDPARFIPQVGEPLELLDPVTGQVVLAYPAPQGMQPEPVDPAAVGAPGMSPGPGDAPADIGGLPPDPGFPQ